MNEDNYIVNPDVDRYLESLLPERDPWFIEMEKLAEAKNFPAVGPQVGTLLEVLARSINAKRIMELGSGFGYSGLWFARALREDGYLLLSDFKEENRLLAESYFKMAQKSNILDYRVGDAMSLLEQEKGPFDIIFNDIDKQFYPQVIEPAYRLLRKGGLFITDNTLWHGKVTQNIKEKTTDSVLEFNNKLKEHKGFITTQIPIRDGVSVCIKIN